MKEVAENTTNIDISDEELKSLTQSILTRYGIDFTCYELKSLKRRVVRTMSVFGYKTVFELWNRLLQDRDFIFKFMNEISVGMTSMFRDPILWTRLKRILSDRQDERATWDIWHAGCSTGEEVYTFGILAQELGIQKKIKALATDINQDAINTAIVGEYHKIKMIENENNYRKYAIMGNFLKYYSKDGKMATMDPALRSHVEFRYHNLITDPIRSNYDILFCRNVMIYFDMIAKRKMIDKFYDAIRPGGLFIIGFYDTMFSIIDPKKFKLIDADAKIFQRI